MDNKKIRQQERRIKQIKKELINLGPLRPGTLCKQYKDPKNKKGAFWQLSYTYQMKSRTEYVRQTNIKQIRNNLKEYKKLKKLIDEWINLSIEISKMKVKLLNQNPP